MTTQTAEASKRATTVAQVSAQMSALISGGIAPDRVFALMVRGGAGGAAAGADGADGAAVVAADAAESSPRGRHAVRAKRGGPAGLGSSLLRGRGGGRGSGRGARPDAMTELQRIAELVDEGMSVPDALREGDGPEWRVLSAAWSIAVRSGAPLGAALERIAGALTALEQLRARRSVILAGPRATMFTVAALPVIALLLGSTLGFDPMPVLVTPFGVALLVMGAALLAAGVLWARAMQNGVAGGDHVAGLECELVWVALKGGVDPRRARVMAVTAVDNAGAEWISFQSFCDDSALGRTLRAARASGVPLATMLVEEAKAIRARAHTDLERDAEKLGVRILVPLATCVLPSFVLVGVVPVILAMLAQQ